MPQKGPQLRSAVPQTVSHAGQSCHQQSCHQTMAQGPSPPGHLAGQRSETRKRAAGESARVSACGPRRALRPPDGAAAAPPVDQVGERPGLQQRNRHYLTAARGLAIRTLEDASPTSPHQRPEPEKNSRLSASALCPEASGIRNNKPRQGKGKCKFLLDNPSSTAT